MVCLAILSQALRMFMAVTVCLALRLDPRFTRPGSTSFTKPPEQVIRIAKNSLHNVAPQTIDFLYVTELLWTETYDLPRLETTVKEEVG